MAEGVVDLADLVVSDLLPQVIVQLRKQVHHGCRQVQVLLVTFLKDLPDDLNTDQLMRGCQHYEV